MRVSSTAAAVGVCAAVLMGLLPAVVSAQDDEPEQPGNGSREEQQKTEQPDRENAQLPAGVIARLGQEKQKRVQSVVSVAYSPDGTKLATGWGNGHISLWDLETGDRQRTPSGHKKGVDALHFSPDGKTLASAGADGTIRLWNAESLEKKQEQTGYDEHWTSLVYAPDGSFLAAGSDSGTVRRWRSGTLEERGILHENTSSVESLAISNNGKRIALGDSGGTLSILNLESKNVETKHSNGSKPLFAVSFSPVGNQIACGGENGTVQLLDVKEGEVHWTTSGQLKGIDAISFSPDGGTLAIGGRNHRKNRFDDNVKLLDTDSGKELRSLIGHTERVYSVAFSPDGSRLATGSRDETVRLWNPDTGEKTRVLFENTAGNCAVEYGPGGTVIATGGVDGNIRIWKTTQQKCVRTLSGHSHRVQSLTFVPGTDLLVSGSSDGTVRAWNWTSGETVWTNSDHRDAVFFVETSVDGRLVASSSGDGTVQVFRSTTGENVSTIDPDTNYTPIIRFAPEDELVIGGVDIGMGGIEANGTEVTLWKSDTGQKIKEFRETQGKNITEFDLSPAGDLLACGSADFSGGFLHMIQTGQQKTLWKKILTGGQPKVIQFSPDGNLLVAVAGRRIHLFDLASGEMVHTFPRSGPRQIKDVSFSPAGGAMAVAYTRFPTLIYSLDPRRWHIDLPITHPETRKPSDFWEKLVATDPLASLQARFELGDGDETTMLFLEKQVEKFLNWSDKDQKRMENFVEKLTKRSLKERKIAQKNLFQLFNGYVSGPEKVERVLKKHDHPEIKKRLGQIRKKLQNEIPTTGTRKRILITRWILKQIDTGRATSVLNDLDRAMGNRK